MTRAYGPKPHNPKHSGGFINMIRARMDRPKPLFRVKSFVWEIGKGGRREGRFISACAYDRVQGTWSYLVRKDAEEKDLGWLGEYSLTSVRP